MVEGHGRDGVDHDGCGAGELVRPHTLLETWVTTARESCAPSKHEREEGTTR
jgi:hypothetical protein